MRLYLVQHGRATTKEEHPDRPLTEEGRNDVRAVLGLVSSAAVPVARILHSGKTRARQTAEILAEGLHEARRAQETDGLDPLAEPAVWANRLEREVEDVMLVGHLPHLGRLAALLLCEDADRPVIAFRQGAVVCLERGEGGRWSIGWMVVPPRRAEQSHG